MLNFFKSKAEGDSTKAQKPKIRIVQAKPGQDMEALKAQLQAEHGGAQEGDISQLFKMFGKDAVKMLKDNGVDIEELITSGVIDREDIPS